MSNGRRISEWIWDKLSRVVKNTDWVKLFFWFGLISIGIIFVTSLVSLIIKLAGGAGILYIPKDQITKHHYLLSATSQVLAAIFALVFSITLIATQFVTKYTHRTIGIVFPKHIAFYILGFALAVIFPLWWLVVPFTIGSFISFAVAALFVLSIPEFFIFLTQKMRTDGVIKHIKTEASKAINLNDEENAKALINALDSIALGAFTDRNFEVFELAVAALTDLTLEINQEQLLDLRDKIKDTCQELIDNPRAPIIIIENLGKAGASAIEERLKSPDAPKNILREDYAIEIIMNVVNLRKKKTPDRLLYFCVAALADMAEAAKRYKDKDIKGEIAKKLEDKIKGVFTYFTDRKSPEGWYNKAKKRVRPLGITP